MNEDTKLNNISESLVQHMSQIVAKNAADPEAPMKRMIDQVKRKRKKEVTIATEKKDIPVQHKIVAKDGFILYDDPMTTCFYDLVKLNNPEVDKILTAAQLVLSDLNGKPIFPRAEVPKDK